MLFCCASFKSYVKLSIDQRLVDLIVDIMKLRKYKRRAQKTRMNIYIYIYTVTYILNVQSNVQSSQ